MSDVEMSAGESEALRPGTLVDSFRIESVLGIGGFGITYRAYDESLERQVAIKEYFPSGLATRQDDDTTLGPRFRGDEDPFAYGLKRFLDEARTLAKFKDRNIVRVNSFLEANGTAYLIMDYEAGRSLADVLQQLGRLTERQCLSVTVHILRGLRSVHGKRFLHRDIKPGNILIRRSGPPVLLDFGAARLALERQAGDVTVMLTPGYAPIEQYGGDAKLGPWSDLYALGATIYHCIVGRAPEPATDRVSATEEDGEDSVQTQLAQFGTGYSPLLRDAVVWMLRVHPKQRPATAQHVLDMLMPQRMANSTASSAMTHLGPHPAGPRYSPGGDTAEDRWGSTAEVATGGASAPDTGPGHQETSTGGGIVDEVLLKRAEEALAGFLGPIAKVLVARSARTAANKAELLRTLAQELDEESERRRFLDSLR